jgi:hypothetical protein
MSFGLVIGFTEYLQIVTTSSYNTIANSLTAAHTKSYQSAVSSLVDVLLFF